MERLGVALVGGFDVRASQLQHTPVADHEPVEDDVLVSVQRVLAERLIGPYRLETAGVVADDRLEYLESSPAGPAQPAVQQLADEGDLLPFPGIGNAVKGRPVLVTKREPRDKVADRGQARTGERLLAPRSNPLDGAEGHVEEGHAGRRPIA